MSKKKDKKKDEKPKQDFYGKIDAETPFGRVFEFEEELEISLENTNGSVEMCSDLIFGEIKEDKDGGIWFYLESPDGAELKWKKEDWDKEVLPHCTGYFDPVVGDPEPVQEDEPKAESNIVDVTTQDLQVNLQIAFQELEQAEKVEAAAKTVFDGAKKSTVSATVRMRNVVGQIVNLQTEGGIAGTPIGEAIKDATKKLTTDQPDLTEEERSIELTLLAYPEIKPKYLKALAKNNPSIVTLGNLVDWQKKKGDFYIKDVKGLGQAARDNIDDATLAFWRKRHNRIQEDLRLENEANE